MIRAFVGVRIDRDTAQRISEGMSQLQRRLMGLRWVPRENLHFTLKFLGPVPEDKIAPITSALQQPIRAVPRFSIIARGIGVFPDIRRPRVLWVGLESKTLATLATEVERALEPLGFAREKRAFQPHLTIGRWRGFASLPAQITKATESWKEYGFGSFWVEEVILFQSVLKPQGAVYSSLEIFPLSRQPN